MLHRLGPYAIVEKVPLGTSSPLWIAYRCAANRREDKVFAVQSFLFIGKLPALSKERQAPSLASGVWQLQEEAAPLCNNSEPRPELKHPVRSQFRNSALDDAISRGED